MGKARVSRKQRPAPTVDALLSKVVLALADAAGRAADAAFLIETLPEATETQRATWRRALRNARIGHASVAGWLRDVQTAMTALPANADAEAWLRRQLGTLDA